ncbi:11936_t:CDS:2 [Funneliformis caledonium]|uniref:11936_t:CDS:1 n=1 Tax=Funneliformis caledonium TaxID=1117310 RepID=A0A9N9FMP0_9GLOM|nr:11936_t:CDS:2 [Funneliformis caledonium]
MISSSIGFLKRHKKKIFITLGITGGTYFLGKFATWKFFEMQERAASERTARENMKRRFQKRQNDCSFAVLSQIPTLTQQLMDELDVEIIFANLQREKYSNVTTTSPSGSVVLVNKNDNGETTSPSSSAVLVDRPNDSEIAKLTETTTDIQGENSNGNNSSNTSQESETNSPLRSPVNPPSEEAIKMSKQLKLELWTEVKFKSFTRTIAAVYLETLLTITTFIQLNLLGKYNYLYSVYSITERDREQSITIQPVDGSILNHVTEKKYLTFIGWFLNVGYRKIVDRVFAAVESSLSSMSFKYELSYQDFVWLISEIRSKVEGNDNGDPANRFFNIMMPEDLSDEVNVLREYGGDMFDDTIDPKLRKLLDETKDFIHSRDFTKVLIECLNSAFNLLYHDMLPHFHHHDTSQKVEKSITLVKLLPNITKEAHVILNGVPNRFLEVIKDCKELQAFSAIIYTSFDENKYEKV